MTPPTTFVAAAVRALRGHGGRPATDAPGGPSWADVAAEARALALGLRTAGVGPGAEVRVPEAAAGPAVRLGREVAVLSAGGALALPATDAAPDGVATVSLGDGGLVTGGTSVTLAELVAAEGPGAESAPDAYEEAVAGVAPDAPALVVAGRVVTHGELLWAHRTVERWLLPVVGPWGPGHVLALPGGVPESSAAPVAAALVGRWWPGLAGAQLVAAVGGGPATPILVLAARADVVVAGAAAWSEIAAGLRDHAERSRRGRALLRHGRLAAAGEPSGPGERAAARLLSRRTAPALREDVGLGRLALGISLGLPDLSTGRDLAALGVPVVPAWVDARVPAPVAAGPVVHPMAAGRWGRPLPGRSISCGGPSSTVCGHDLPGGAVDLPVRADADGRDRVALR